MTVLLDQLVEGHPQAVAALRDLRHRIDEMRTTLQVIEASTTCRDTRRCAQDALAHDELGNLVLPNFS
jgi:hypothetical protein